MTRNSVHLPLELIKEVLLRLPVKSVLRCKCVRKSWLSLVSNPDFATSHFQLAASPTNKLICLGNNSDTLSVDFNASLNDDSSYASLSLEFRPPLFWPEIGGSCRGFLFLHTYKDFYLWNPSTGAHKQIPASPEAIAWDEDIYMPIYGFGYEPSRDDYLVVLWSYGHDDSETDDTSIVLEIFSLRANEWKQIRGDSVFPYVSTADGSKTGLLFKGALHGPVFNHVISKVVLTTFDLREMTTSEIPLPDEFYCFYPPVKYHLLIFRGLMSAWIQETDRIDIWVMQEYAVQSSWTKTLVFSLHPSPCFSPVYFTNCGHIVGIDCPGRELVKFNHNGQLIEQRAHSNGYIRRSQLAVYTESLLSLPEGIEQA